MKSGKVPRLAVPLDLVYRLFYPQVPLVLSAKFRGAVAAMPAVSCMSVSNDPPIIGVAVGKMLRTNHVLKRAKNFCLNWIDFGNRQTLNALSSPGTKADKLKTLGIHYMKLMGTPVLKSSIAYVICERKKLIDAGDHDLFLGRVIGAMASLDFDEYWKFSDYRPILYLGSAFKTPFNTFKTQRSSRQ